DGKRTAFIGYEAKMEKRALDVSDVEQLCLKLNDMPDLTTRAIVSANGFSDSARRKATAHGVRLYEFRNWTERVRDKFPHHTLVGTPDESLVFGCNEFRWVSGYCVFGRNRASENQEPTDVPLDTPLFQVNGAPHLKHATTGEFRDAIVK